MLDLGWSELLVVAVVALIVVGPKELPTLLRTVGKFVNMIRRQAGEFRSQFDEAIKDTEFEQVRKDFQELKDDATSTVRDATRAIEDEVRDIDDNLDDVSQDIDRQLKAPHSAGSPDAVSASATGDDTRDEIEQRWMDDYNRNILDAEERAKADGTSSISEIDDPGASDDDYETVAADSPAANDTAAKDPAAKDSVKAVEKAGAAT